MILKIALVALLVGNCTVNVPDVDVLTAPKSKTITAALVLVVAEVFELYITAACAEIDSTCKTNITEVNKGCVVCGSSTCAC